MISNETAVVSNPPGGGGVNSRALVTEMRETSRERQREEMERRMMEMRAALREAEEKRKQRLDQQTKHEEARRKARIEEHSKLVEEKRLKALQHRASVEERRRLQLIEAEKKHRDLLEKFADKEVKNDLAKLKLTHNTDGKKTSRTMEVSKSPNYAMPTLAFTNRTSQNSGASTPATAIPFSCPRCRSAPPLSRLKMAPKSACKIESFSKRQPSADIDRFDKNKANMDFDGQPMNGCYPHTIKFPRPRPKSKTRTGISAERTSKVHPNERDRRSRTVSGNGRQNSSDKSTPELDKLSDLHYKRRKPPAFNFVAPRPKMGSKVKDSDSPACKTEKIIIDKPPKPRPIQSRKAITNDGVQDFDFTSRELQDSRNQEKLRLALEREASLRSLNDITPKQEVIQQDAMLTNGFYIPDDKMKHDTTLYKQNIETLEGGASIEKPTLDNESSNSLEPVLNIDKTDLDGEITSLEPSSILEDKVIEADLGYDISPSIMEDKIDKIPLDKKLTSLETVSNVEVIIENNMLENSFPPIHKIDTTKINAEEEINIELSRLDAIPDNIDLLENTCINEVDQILLKDSSVPIIKTPLSELNENLNHLVHIEDGDKNLEKSAEQIIENSNMLKNDGTSKLQFKNISEIPDENELLQDISKNLLNSEEELNADGQIKSDFIKKSVNELTTNIQSNEELNDSEKVLSSGPIDDFLNNKPKIEDNYGKNKDKTNKITSINKLSEHLNNEESRVSNLITGISENLRNDIDPSNENERVSDKKGFLFTLSDNFKISNSDQEGNMAKDSELKKKGFLEEISEKLGFDSDENKNINKESKNEKDSDDKSFIKEATGKLRFDSDSNDSLEKENDTNPEIDNLNPEKGLISDLTEKLGITLENDNDKNKIDLPDSDPNNKLKQDKKEKSTDCDSALIPLLCVHG